MPWWLRQVMNEGLGLLPEHKKRTTSESWAQHCTMQSITSRLKHMLGP